MSFIADKKREHEAAAEKALVEKDYATALFHTAKAAEFGLLLAEQSEGKIAKRYVEDAFELIKIAERLKTKASTQPSRDSVDGLQEPISDDDETPDWLLKEKPAVTFSDLIGLDDLKTRIRRFVTKFEHPDEVAKWPGARLGDRMILYGPPGTGKTMFAKAIANEIDADFFQVKGSNILSKWVGESQKNVRRLFDGVRSAQRAVVFLDEIDGILSKRGSSSSSVRDGVVSEFLQEMEGLSSPNTSVLFVGATNLPKGLDPAVVSRFGGLFYVPLPPLEARLEFLRREFRKFPYGYDEALDLQLLADQLEGHSMRSLAVLIQVLIDIGMLHKIEGSDGKITRADVDSAKASLPAPMSAKDIEVYEAFASKAEA